MQYMPFRMRKQTAEWQQDKFLAELTPQFTQYPGRASGDALRAVVPMKTEFLPKCGTGTHSRMQEVVCSEMQSWNLSPGSSYAPSLPTQHRTYSLWVWLRASLPPEFMLCLSLSPQIPLLCAHPAGWLHSSQLIPGLFHVASQEEEQVSLHSMQKRDLADSFCQGRPCTTPGTKQLSSARDPAANAIQCKYITANNLDTTMVENDFFFFFFFIIITLQKAETKQMGVLRA